MPSRAYTSFLLSHFSLMNTQKTLVSMPSRAYTSFLQGREETAGADTESVNALSGLYLISTRCAQGSQRSSNGVSMPSRAYTSFLPRYRGYE